MKGLEVLLVAIVGLDGDLGFGVVDDGGHDDVFFWCSWLFGFVDLDAFGFFAAY